MPDSTRRATSESREPLQSIIDALRNTATYQAAPAGDRELIDELATHVRDTHHTVRALHETESLYSSLVENLPIHVARKDLDGKFTYANESFCDLIGLTLSETIGKTDHDLFPKSVADKYRSDDLWVIETGKVFECVEENPAGGQTRYYEVRKTPVRINNGHIVGIQIIFWDVTHRVQAQTALRDAKEAAEAANRAKTDFVANISHEIRTPLNAIIGMTEILLNTEVDVAQQDYLSMVRDSGETLLSLINDVLDFSKIEAGKLELDPVSFDLHEVLGTTMKTLAVRAKSDTVELVLRMAPDVPRVVIGDALRLRQIVVNLIGNAIKFTEAGEIGLSVACQSIDGDDIVLHFRATDTGIGMPEEIRKVIFGAFEQADSSTTRRYGGTGLGLAITSRLVAAMEGTITVESVVNEGSCFEFTTRLRLPSEQPKAPMMNVKRCRVLVVDDNRSNRENISEMITYFGATAVAATGGDHALEVFKDSVKANEPFHLVITDIAMPNMSGYELIESLCDQSLQQPPQFIVMNPHLGRGDLERCRELGVAGHLLKPVKRSELRDALQRTVANSSSKAPSPDREDLQAERRRQLRSLNVLVAEDTLVNQKLAIGLLERENHHVTVVNNGREAVDAIKAPNHFDVILMDVHMPIVDGLEATRQIREFEATTTGRRIPIIAMTARAMHDDREKCLSEGMDGYITKPIRVETLEHELANLRTCDESDAGPT